MEQSFAVGMSIHWAEFYNDLKMCQEQYLRKSWSRPKYGQIS